MYNDNIPGTVLPERYPTMGTRFSMYRGVILGLFHVHAMGVFKLSWFMQAQYGSILDCFIVWIRCFHITQSLPRVKFWSFHKEKKWQKSHSQTNEFFFSSQPQLLIIWQTDRLTIDKSWWGPSNHCNYNLVNLLVLIWSIVQTV